MVTYIYSVQSRCSATYSGFWPLPPPSWTVAVSRPRVASSDLVEAADWTADSRVFIAGDERASRGKALRSRAVQPGPFLLEGDGVNMDSSEVWMTGR